MVVTIPEDFSKKVSTLMNEKPEPAKLQYKVNPVKLCSGSNWNDGC